MTSKNVENFVTDVARLCAEAMGTEAVHRALVRHAQNELGKFVGVPNDVGFENFDWRGGN